MIGAPVLRLRGDYLAIVTLGFGEIARVIFGSTWAQSLFGGANGMGNITDAPIPGLGTHFQSDPRHFYYLVLAFCLVAVFVSWRLQDSRVGRAWNAMREDEQVADAMGISTTRFKLLAFAMGGAIGSLGGALFAVQPRVAHDRQLPDPGARSPRFRVIILGGLGSIPGRRRRGLVLIGLPGVLTEFEDYRLLIYGAVLIAIMLLRPQGLVPNVRRSRELAGGRATPGPVGASIRARATPSTHSSHGEVRSYDDVPGGRWRLQALRRPVRAEPALDLTVDEGEIVSVIGPNGAGKSTVFNVITGLYRARRRRDAVPRRDASAGRAPSQVTKLGIARTFQNVKLFPNMTVLENAMVGQHCRTQDGSVRRALPHAGQP